MFSPSCSCGTTGTKKDHWKHTKFSPEIHAPLRKGSLPDTGADNPPKEIPENPRQALEMVQQTIYSGSILQ